MNTSIYKRKISNFLSYNPISKKIKQQIDNTNDDDDDDDDDDDKHNIAHLLVNNNNVFIENNHIYFKTDVNKESVNCLIKLMNKYIDDFILLQKDNSCFDIKPKPLFIHITSNGGYIQYGFIAYDYIKLLLKKFPIYTIIEGNAFSMASIISMAGLKRFILPSSYMLLHQLSSGFKGKYDDIQDECAYLDDLMKKIIEIYILESKEKMTKTFIKNLLKQEQMLDAKKCIKYGLVDEIYTGQTE